MANSAYRKENCCSHVALAVCNGFATLREEEICTDFVVQVQDKRFPCHKTMLASASDYFKAMFTSGMKEATQNETILDNVRPECFEFILDLLYMTKTGEDPLHKLADEEAVEVYRVADMFQITCIADVIVTHFRHTILTSNCTDRMAIGKKADIKELYNIAFNYVLFNFDDVVAKAMLQACDYEELLRVLNDENLTVSHEENVWYAVSSWIKFDIEHRQDFIDHLIQYCCLTEVNFQVLTEEITFDPIVRGSKEATRVVRDAVHYRYHPSIHGYLELNYRRSMNKMQVDVLLGVSIESECPMLTMFGTHGAWLRDVLGNGPTGGYAFCVHGNSIFVSGGEDPYARNLYEFDGTNMAWRKLRGQLPIPLSQHTMVATDDHLYAVSGCSQEKLSWVVYQYFIKQRSWHKHGEVIAPVADASSVCLNEKIYIIGGVTDDEQPVQVIQEYDLSSKSATIICDLPSPCSFSQSLIRQDTIYIVTANGEVLILDMPEVKLNLLAIIPELETEQNFGITVRNNELKIFCGDTPLTEAENSGPEEDEDIPPEIKRLTKNILVDLTSGEQKAIETALNPPYIFGCVTIVINSAKKPGAAPAIPPRNYKQ